MSTSKQAVITDEIKRAEVADIRKEIRIYLRVIAMPTAIRTELNELVDRLAKESYTLGENEAAPRA